MSSQSALVLSEDDERRLLIAESLRGGGFVVVEAGSAEHAAAILRHFRFDLLVVASPGPGDRLLRTVCGSNPEHVDTSVLLTGVLGRDGARATYGVAHLAGELHRRIAS